MEEENLFYVSHLIVNELPKEGLCKLYFYTKRENKYYFGTDNNSFSEKDMKILEDKRKIIKLSNLLEIPKTGKTLWTDSDGKVYIADSKKPYSEKLNSIEGIVLTK